MLTFVLGAFLLAAMKHLSKQSEEGGSIYFDSNEVQGYSRHSEESHGSRIFSQLVTLHPESGSREEMQEFFSLLFSFGPTGSILMSIVR